MLLNKINDRHEINLYLKNGKCHIPNKHHKGRLLLTDPDPVCDVIESNDDQEQPRYYRSTIVI